MARRKKKIYSYQESEGLENVTRLFKALIESLYQQHFHSVPGKGSEKCLKCDRGEKILIYWKRLLELLPENSGFDSGRELLQDFFSNQFNYIDNEDLLSDTLSASTQSF